MRVSELAGRPAPPGHLIDPARLVQAYYDLRPDPALPEQRVSFGTSGHRGSSFNCTFNEWHVLAITEAICRQRRQRGVTGPLFLGKDTHALSEPAMASVLEVLAAHRVETRIDLNDGFTPTPAISHSILLYNRRQRVDPADGIVITPSHNPPEDGGIKYNPPHGGPAAADLTGAIEREANALLAAGLAGVSRMPGPRARTAPWIRGHDYIGTYVEDLPAVVDIDAIRRAGVRMGVDPLGGASLAYWQAIAERHRLPIEVMNRVIDPAFGFMTVDFDGKIRMDCSSPAAMARLIALKDRFDLAFANDPDADRHGIVVPGSGLMNPNHFLAVAVSHLFGAARDWPGAAVGKTAVSSSLIDRVARGLGCRLVEVPVGFKWFVDGLLEGELGFGGEESAGASFLRRDGGPWTTDKDGMIMALLAAEITARSGRDPGQLYEEMAGRYGRPAYQRVDSPATAAQRARLGRITPDQVSLRELAGEPVQQVLTTAPGNGAPLGGVKVVAQSCWFAARPSGTEDIYKIYAESFSGEDHLAQVLVEAQSAVDASLGGR
jgi:phosphoglucomutase